MYLYKAKLGKSPTLIANALVITRKHNIRQCGQGSSVSIATDYGVEGPGLNPGGDEIFRPSRPALGPTQPPVEWDPSLSRG